MSSSTPAPAMPDLVGIGMINLDYIVGRSAESVFLPESFELGAETAASASDIDSALRFLAKLKPKTSPGGSALNTIASAATTNSPVKVGYIGCFGTESMREFDFPSWFSLLGIDTPFVKYCEGPVGRCVSYGRGDKRAMRTWYGANKGAGEFFRENREAILHYLTTAKAVHVTPFTGVPDLSPIAELLQDLKYRYPAILLSCDPGHFWTESKRPPEADSILAASDLLILNDREFAQLSQRLPWPAMSDLDAAQICMAEFAGVTSILVLKSYNKVVLFSRLGREVLERAYSGQPSSSSDNVVDDTGSGDAFAAGYLVGRLLPGFDTTDCIEFGLRLASRKLEFSGMTEIQRFAEEYSAMATRLANRAREEAVAGSPKVFIGHGRDASWTFVRDRLRDWGLQPTYFEAEALAGRFVSDILTSQALNSDFAVITMTGDDRDDGGHVRSRQNVVHEIGLMQGRLGWARVAILLEDGVEQFTNLDGLQYIPFARGRINQAFDDLRRMLEREGLLSVA